MKQQNVNSLLLTWLDVERRFKLATANFQKFEASVTAIRCYADGAEIEVVGDVSAVKLWLRSIFPRSLSDDASSVVLEIGQKAYPIDFVVVTVKTEVASCQYPLWRDQAYLDSEQSQQGRYPPAWGAGPAVVAFHSFKGGVGRTTSLMTYAAARLDAAKDRPIRILLIDADLEAPGITFWLDEVNKPSVSFVHFLEAVHFPPVDVETSLNYFAAELRKTSLNVGGANREIFILPAALRLAEIMDMPVKPEHIASNPGNPWLLSDHLRSLGGKLQADIVFVDLRAGLSELVSPLLFDPRVEHFFVTTVAPQSVAGMSEILGRINSFQNLLPEERRGMAKPTLILSLLTPQLKQLPDYTLAIQKLSEAMPAEVEDVVSSGVEWIESDFEQALMSIGSVRQSLELLRKSSLYSSALDWAVNRYAEHEIRGEVPATDRQQNENEAAKLFRTCEQFQFAERTTTDDMLVTEPLRNLAKHYSSDLPNAVSVGAKGAGKTFTYLQICRTKNWAEFLKKLGSETPTIQGGDIYPLLYSANLDGDSLAVVQGARSASAKNLSLADVPKAREVLSIASALRNPATDWDAFWEGMLINEFPVGATTLANLNSWLIKNNKSVVLVVDGLEDHFSEPEDENQKRAIKALLQLPNQLNELQQRRIGFVCFVRADYVQSAIRQNVAQYLSRFQPFRLEWTAETFLRLAYWICGKANVINADPEKAAQLGMLELLKELERLWGKKMGRDDSKEAMSARWVFAALCDLNGRLQARDLVRFLKFAAKRMDGAKTDAWQDRLLLPEVIRKSLPDCSDEKVTEAITEIGALRKWVEKLDSLPPEARRIPFGADALQLSSELLGSLRELGVVYEDTDHLDEAERFYLPEIYRSGLKFRSGLSGRPRVQALLKRNLGGMPF